MTNIFLTFHRHKKFSGVKLVLLDPNPSKCVWEKIIDRLKVIRGSAKPVSLAWFPVHPWTQMFQAGNSYNSDFSYPTVASGKI